MIRLHCEPVKTWWPLPPWACGLLIVWTAAAVAWGMAGPMMAAVAGSDPASTSNCLMRRVLDIPCAACGGTRAALALGRGSPYEAWLFNPMGTVGIAIAVIWLGVFYAGRRRIVLEARGRGRMAVWIIAVAVLLANWAWVLTAGRV